jgi:hypothetical protein
MALISTKLRNSARGQPCTLQTSYCSGNTETVVLCHCPSEWKGMGNKSPDWIAAFGCFECHTAMDQHRFDAPTEAYYWFRGILRTWAIWIGKGLIVLPVDIETAKKRPRKKAKIPSRPLRSRSFSSTRNQEDRS